MWYIIGIQYSQRKCHSYPIISTKSGSVGGYHSVLKHQSQSIMFKIYITVRILLTYHIHMSLQHNRRAVLISRSSILEYNYIVAPVLYKSQISVCGKLHQIITYPLCIRRSVWDPAYLLKKTKHFIRFNI